MIKSVLDWIYGYKEADLPRIADIWRDIWIMERIIMQLEKGKLVDTSREQLIDAKYALMRLKNELSGYRPEDVERGRKAA